MLMRQATFNDYQALNRLYNAARGGMIVQGNPQWAPNYPSHEDIVGDLTRGELWVSESDTGIISAVSLVFGDDPTYRNIRDGAWLNDAPYAAIHRLAVDPAMQGKGQGADVLTFCENVVREKGLSNLRIDTHARNPAMQALVKKMSYCYCGIIVALDGDDRYAYQKVLL